MKTLVAGMQTMVAGNGRTLEWAVTFTRSDAQVFRFTSAAKDATISANLYASQPGFSVSSITSTLGYVVDTLEMTVLTNDDMTIADFLAGRWDGCEVTFDQYDWTTVANGFIPWPKYRVAEIQPIQGGFVLELRDMRQLMLQDYTRNSAKTCPYRLGDTRCAKVLTSFTHSFTVTGVTSRSIFTCSGLAQATDYFSNGQVTFVDGLYAGLPLLVRAHTTGGVLTLAVPLVEDIVVAQTGTIIAGCLKRFEEDCRVKYNNALNFGGQKDLPSTETLVGQ